MKPTMKEIARELDISINAVSLALNNKAGVSDEMRIKILRTADKMGYLCKKKRYEQTFCQLNICIMMQRIYATDMNFYGKVLYAVTEEAKRGGMDTLMSFFDDQDFILPHAVEERRVSGIIVIGKIADPHIEKLQEYNIPLVQVDHASLTRPVDSILTDNKQGGYIAAKYLLERGFRKIGYFGDLDYSLSIKERFFGYEEALKSSLFAGKSLVRRELETYVARYSVTRHLEHWILNNDNSGIREHLAKVSEIPEAFICSNDRAAIALAVSLQSLGYQVPQDVSIIGFDNIDMCRKVHPKITTIKVDKEAMGRRAVERIKYRIDHRDCPTENVVLGIELIERDSVALHGE